MTFTPPRTAPPWLRALAWFGVLAWAGSITLLSSMPPDQLANLSSVKLWDKAAHYLAFAVGAANLALVLRWSWTWSAARIALVAILIIAFFAATDEIHQLFTPGRSGGDVFDWLADMLGAATGAGIILLLYARSPRPPHLAPAGD
jgi:VanZ family protein